MSRTRPSSARGMDLMAAGSWGMLQLALLVLIALSNQLCPGHQYQCSVFWHSTVMTAGKFVGPAVVVHFGMFVVEIALEDIPVECIVVVEVENLVVVLQE